MKITRSIELNYLQVKLILAQWAFNHHGEELGVVHPDGLDVRTFVRGRGEEPGNCSISATTEEES